MAKNLQTSLAQYNQLLKQPILLPFEISYRQVYEELRRWRALTLNQLDTMCERILIDLSSSFDDVHQFALFTDGLLVEQQEQLERATTNDEFDIIQARLKIILAEIQLLQCLSFGLDCNAVKLIGNLNITCQKDEIQLLTSDHPINNDCQSLIHSSNTSTSGDRSPTPFSQHRTPYRLLISRADAIELDKNAISNFHFSSYANESISEVVLTIDVNDLDSFLDAFDSYWMILSIHHDVRLLISQSYIPLIMGELGKTARRLIKHFELDQMKIFSNPCPKSDERILLLQGKRIESIKRCIKEIYCQIERSNNNNKSKTKLYDPASLTTIEIEEMTMADVDYGGFAIKQQQNRERTRSIRTDSVTTDGSSLLKDAENSSSDDENNHEDHWADFRHVRGNDPEAICREIVVNDVQAGVIIGVNATRIDSIKQKTGAYVYVRGDSNDPKRSVFIKGTRDQVERAVKTIEHLIECHKNDKLPMKQRRVRGKNKTKG